jgi:MFS superfamily sulfate permease-like transporter
MEWLLIMLIIGALLPVGVAGGALLLNALSGGRADWPMATAFGKGIGLGVIMGLTVSAISVGLVLGVAWLAGR